MSHQHKHATPKTLSNLIFAIIINVGIVIFEITLGIISGSLALISEAFHNITDISSMILGYISEKISLKPGNSQKTYGYKKIEFITAFVNSLILLLATIYIFYEATIRLFEPIKVLSLPMFYAGIVAVIGNGIATWILAKDSKQNTNMKAVWLHSLQDALLSVGVIFGAIIIYFTGWNIVDPLISILISFFLIKSIYSLIKETLNALLDSVPQSMNYEAIKKDLLNINEIKDVKDLHIWLANSHTPILSVHIQIESSSQLENTFIKAKNILHDKYNIEHATLQIIPQKILENKELHCEHCN